MQTIYKSARFHRTERLLGSNKTEKIRKAFVVVVGAGAVGGYAIEALARCGVGNIRVIDYDTIDETNINRQILALSSTIGEYKADMAEKRIKDINPLCNTEALQFFFNQEKADQTLCGGFSKQKPDLVIDAIDSVSSKAALLIECLKREIPVISSMGAALRIDTEKIKIADLMKSHSCSLARLMRKKVRQAGYGKGVICVYSDEKVNYEFIDPQNDPMASMVDEAGEGRDGARRVLGSLPTITGIFGLTIANIAVKQLTGD